MMWKAIQLIIFGGTSSASGADAGTGNGTMDFSIATGDDTGLLALLEDI